MTANSLSLASRVKLANGETMPQIHLGVYLMHGEEADEAIKCSLETGYRGFDSAECYHNENDVGKAINSFLSSPKNTTGLKRQDIFYTTKLADNSTYDHARQTITRCVKECGLGYIDLFLLHSPYGGREARLESWRAIEDAIDAGEVRMGGVSNFGEKHIRELLETSPKHLPQVNQIEVHPFNTRAALCSFCTSQNIVVQAYCPLARALRMSHPTVKALSAKHDCTPAQILIRWSVQKGYVPLPKSSKPERIRQNADIENVVLDQDEMKQLDDCEEGLLTDWNPLDAD